MKRRHEQKLVIISLVLFIVLNAPVILVFNINNSILGIPVLYFVIFSFWAITSIVSYIILKKHYE